MTDAKSIYGQDANATGQAPDDAPADFPEDPQEQISYVIAEILSSELASLRRGDVAQLQAFTDLAIRMVYNGHPPTLATMAGCVKCTQCRLNFEVCKRTQPYSACLAAYQACCNCPCNPG